MSGPTQQGGTNPNDPGPRPADGAMGDRIAAASSAVPDPKGKGLVMIILAVGVLGGLAWEFSGHGAASKATREAVERQRREAELNEGQPIAKDNPADKDTPTTAPRRAPDVSDAPFIELKIDAMNAKLPPALAVAAWVKSAPEKREAMRVAILDALLPLAKKNGRAGQEAFEAAAWLVEGADEDATEAILHLTNAAPAALEDDRAAQAAILFLSRVPDGVDKRTALSLDGVIADTTRPLAIRLAAAELRPKAGMSKRVRALIEDTMTHPALREALQK